MIKYAKIDESGLFERDVWVPNQASTDAGPNLISEPIPQGLYHPRWDGEKWVEGKSREAIEAIEKSRKPRSRLSIWASKSFSR